MPWFSPPALQYVSRFSGNPPRPPFHPGGARPGFGPGGGRRHHHPAGPSRTRHGSPEAYHPGGGFRWSGTYYPGGGHFENNPYRRERNGYFPDLPIPGRWDESMRDEEDDDHYDRVMNSMSSITDYEFNPRPPFHPGGARPGFGPGGGRRHRHPAGPSRTRHGSPESYHPGGGFRWGGEYYPGGGHFQNNPPGCRENGDGSQSCWYSNPRSSEPRHDVLCGCGWGRLAMRESEIPLDCPVCGYELGGPGPGDGRRSDDYYRGMQAEQDDYDDPSWGAAYGDAWNNNPPQNWSAGVQTRWSPPAGLFARGSAHEIAREVLEGHDYDLASSIQSIQFYVNRNLRRLHPERVRALDEAKEIVRREGRRRVRNNACYGIHFHQSEPFTAPQGLFEAAHGQPRLGMRGHDPHEGPARRPLPRPVSGYMENPPPVGPFSDLIADEGPEAVDFFDAASWSTRARAPKPLKCGSKGKPFCDCPVNWACKTSKKGTAKKASTKKKAPKKKSNRKVLSNSERCTAKKNSGERCAGRKLPKRKTCVFHSPGSKMKGKKS